MLECRLRQEENERKSELFRTELACTLDEVLACRGKKKRVSFFNISFVASTRNPRRNVCVHFSRALPNVYMRERTQNVIHISEVVGVKKGIPNEPFRAAKILVYCLLPAPTLGPIVHFSPFLFQPLVWEFKCRLPSEAPTQG